MTWITCDRRIVHYQQPTANSCWWACTSMLMRAGGRTFRRLPDHYRAVFHELPTDRVRGLQALASPSPRSWYAERSMTSRWQRERQYFDGLRFSRGFLHPSHWWRLGCPRDPDHITVWTRLTPLRRASRLGTGSRAGVDATGGVSAAGRANAQLWWDTLERRPVIVTQPRPNNTFHSLIARGIRRRRGDPVEMAEVILQDPWVATDRMSPRTLLMVITGSFIALRL